MPNFLVESLQSSIEPISGILQQFSEAELIADLLNCDIVKFTKYCDKTHRDGVIAYDNGQLKSFLRCNGILAKDAAESIGIGRHRHQR